MTELNPYERKVEATVDASAALSRTMLDDLDVERGGFGWWHGYLDWKRIALISEYTIAALGGVSDALTNAAFQAQELKETTFADNTWLRHQLTSAGKKPGASTETLLRAIQRGAYERKRARRAEIAQEHFFYHVAQCLDRLSAVVISVAALPTSIVRADWRVIEKCLNNQKQESKYLQPLDTESRHAQNDLFSAIQHEILSGPEDWLEWVLRARDTSAHRAPIIHWNVQIIDGTSPRWIAPLHRQPDWTATETLISAQDHESAFLWKDPVDTIDGILDLLNRLASVSIHEAASLWSRRKQDPTILVQPGQQWPILQGAKVLKFDGLGRTLPQPGKGAAVHVHPDLARRLKATRVLDAEAAPWRD